MFTAASLDRVCLPSQVLTNLNEIENEGWLRLKELQTNESSQEGIAHACGYSFPFSLEIPASGKRPMTMLNVNVYSPITDGKMNLTKATLHITMWSRLNGDRCSPPSEVTNKVYKFVLSPTHEHFTIKLKDGTPKCEREN